jgi:hypothetical protein
MKQHYIPRFYLRRFSDDGKSIHTYDKQLAKVYNASMMSVCCEDDIYTISDDFVKKSNMEGGKINKLSLEQEHFARTEEPLFLQLLKEIDEIRNEWVSGKEHYRLKHIEKRELALHIVTLFFRHPKLKESTVNDYLRMENAEIDMVKAFLAKQKNDDSINDLKINVTCEAPVLHANLTYKDNETLMGFADAIASNIWIFEVSKGGDFYTCDFPIVVEPHVENARPMYMGLAQYGGELTFPLSPNLVLSVFDKEYFKDKEKDDCSFIIVGDKEIRRQNMLRYFYASRHVFSIKNDFKLIDIIYKIRGRQHVFMNANFKTEIISGLGRY